MYLKRRSIKENFNVIVLYKWNCSKFVVLYILEFMMGLSAFFENITTLDFTQLESVIKLVLSLVLGSVIGFERKRKGQTAGVRTFALISMGATISMILSIYLGQEYMGDSARIAAQVVSGIGFLGAGAIIQMKGSVRGLTTAAGIWVSAAVGMMVGTGLYLLAVIATLCVLFVLSLLEVYEQKVNFAWSTKVVRIKIDGIIASVHEYVEVFESFGIHINDTYMTLDYENNFTIANFVILSKSKTDFSKLFLKLGDLNTTLSVTLTNEINN